MLRPFFYTIFTKYNSISTVQARFRFRYISLELIALYELIVAKKPFADFSAKGVLTRYHLCSGISSVLLHKNTYLCELLLKSCPLTGTNRDFLLILTLTIDILISVGSETRFQSYLHHFTFKEPFSR